MYSKFLLFACFLMDEAGDGKGGGGGNSDPKDGKGTIKAEDFDRLNADLKSEREIRAKLESELKAERETKLKEKEDYKTLYQTELENRKSLQERHDKLKKNVEYNEKHKAVTKALLDAGVKKDALKILDRESLEEVRVEHTSEGRMLVQGAETYVDKFKREFAFAFEKPKEPKVNGGGGAGGDVGGDDEITPTKLYELEKKHGPRSDEYQKALARYREQRAKRK